MMNDESLTRIWCSKVVTLCQSGENIVEVETTTTATSRFWTIIELLLIFVVGRPTVLYGTDTSYRR